MNDQQESKIVVARGTEFSFGDRIYAFEFDLTSDARIDSDVSFHPVDYPHIKMSATLNFLREQGVL